MAEFTDKSAKLSLSPQLSFKSGDSGKEITVAGSGVKGWGLFSFTYIYVYFIQLLKSCIFQEGAGLCQWQSKLPNFIPTRRRKKWLSVSTLTTACAEIRT